MTQKDIDILAGVTGEIRSFLLNRYDQHSDYGKSIMIEIEIRVMSSNPHEFNKCHSISRGYWNPPAVAAATQAQPKAQVELSTR